MNSTDLIFRSENRRFGVRFSTQVVQTLFKMCKAAGMKETGGILLGEYNAEHDTAIVIAISGQPPDSRRGCTWFLRGIKGLQNLLTTFWREKKYYLGEWHFHPNGVPVPSKQDSLQMSYFAKLPQHHCPEPILVIIGGKPSQLVLRAYVYLDDESCIPLA